MFRNISNEQDGFYESPIVGARGERKWSAPETRRKLSYSVKCESWSIGCLLYYMISGNEPDEITKQASDPDQSTWPTRLH